MRKLTFVFVCLLLVLAVPVFAQEATPEATQNAGTGGTATVTVADQISVNGMVVVDSATVDVPGFVVIHADMGGTPGHVVGVAPLQAGTNSSVMVMIDGAMSTPILHVALHADDNQNGVFEHVDDPNVDLPVSAVPAATFRVGAIVAFDQQPMNNTAVIASVISEAGGWLAIHADENGQPGAVLGFSPLVPGTNAPVLVTLAAEGVTPVVWAVVHADDGQVGTFEFGTVENADMPLALNDMALSRPVTLTDAPTLVLADNTPLQANTAPTLTVSGQADTAAEGAEANLIIDAVTSVGPGIVDVHNDAGGHPGGSLGHAVLNDGENTGISVPLMSKPMVPMTMVVWPMLHSDTNANGVYEYLKVPGVDLPIVYNGMVVTTPVSIGGAEAIGTAEATAAQ